MASQSFDDFHLKFYDKRTELEVRRARLFPAFEKLKVIDEDVTSNIFLAGLIGIKEYCTAFFKEIDIKLKANSKVHAFSQVDFDRGIIADKKDTPDGMIVITDGATNPIVSWVALLEFKTNNTLKREQVERYAKIAKDPKYRFDAIISISNDFVSNTNQNPFGLKNTENLRYYHFSWIRIQTLLQYVIHQGINDDDQVYLAEQLLLYMKEHKFITNFNQMNKNWSDQSKEIVSSSKISGSKNKELLSSIANDWLQEEQDLGLKIKAKYGKDISVWISSNERQNIEKRVDTIKEHIIKNSSFQTTYKVIQNTSKKMPYSLTNQKSIDVNHKILLPRKNQEISFGVFYDNCQLKTLKKQVEYFISAILRSKPGLMGEIYVLTFVKGKNNEISKKSLDDYQSDRNRDILKGFTYTSAKAEVRKFEIKCSFDIGKDFSNRKGLITRIESNFINFYTQLLEPFTI